MKGVCRSLIYDAIPEFLKKDREKRETPNSSYSSGRGSN
jgi:hypothetical protein